ncbi:MAG: IS4 family transposase, partial [Thiothrix sp.]|nr:IS4 family transposase [Thiothrix sp.]
MELGDGLRDSLKVRLDWGKPRLECFVGMLLGLLRLKQVNLTQLALGFAGDAGVKSRYRRLQRFFARVWFDYDAIARLQMDLFDFPRQKYYLTLDRTNWQWGKTDINILTLGVVYKGSAIPVY